MSARKRSHLKLKDFKLNTLLEITKAINNNLSAKKLFGLYEYVVINQLEIGKVILFSNNGKSWECVLAHGVENNEKRFNVERDLLHIKDITLIESSSKEHLSSFDVAIPVYHKSAPLAYLLLGDVDEQKVNISPIIKHLPFIQVLTNIIVVAIENKRLAREHIRQAKIEKELELAHEMQSMLFPNKLPDDDKLQAAAIYQPHAQVGGDYYDFISLNENEVLFCVADVSGKGVSAALLMANFQANLRAMAAYKNSLVEIVFELNKKVMSNAKGEKFITLFIARYNLRDRVLKYVNAAHNPPLLKNSKTIEQLNVGSTGLGMFDSLPSINQGEIKVEKNSILVCYTDGVVELENEKEEPFGTEKLKALISEGAGSMQEMNKNILGALVEHKGAMPYIDDIALFSIRFR
jgi:phosphoserine phosphatase RsbU/P